MVNCHSCGSKLVFDIDSQMMKCSYCERKYSVKEASSWSKDAEERVTMTTPDGNPVPKDAKEWGEMIDVTAYICSQCGAEIIADPDEAVTWCSFCGSPATLHGRLTRIRKPDSVIPFKINKTDCTTMYRNLAKKQIYAPRALVRRGEADGFRGIYMPFWAYSVKRNGRFHFQGQQEELILNDRYIVDYDIYGNITSDCPNLTHDASLYFDDAVSEHGVPFRMDQSGAFNECYLHGFYASAADFDAEEYRNKMIRVENNVIVENAKNTFHEYGLNEDSVIRSLSHVHSEHPSQEYDPLSELKDPLYDRQLTQDKPATAEEPAKPSSFNVSSKLSMLPVWFYSYRFGERVSYATINGQTGKMYADFPVSPLRFLLFSLLTALPIFAAFWLTITATPTFVLFVMMIAAMVFSSLYQTEVSEIFQRQNNIRVPKPKRKSIGKIIYKIIMTTLTVLFAVLYICIETMSFPFVFVFDIIAIIPFEFFFGGLSIVALIIFIRRFVRMRNLYDSMSGIFLLPTNGCYILVSLVAIACFFLRPAEDLIFYGVACIALLAVALTMLSLIRCYNILSTIQPKQFRRNGGEIDA